MLETGAAAAATSILLFAAYYIVPFEDRTAGGTVVRLLLSAIVFVAVLIWQARRVTGSDRPVLRSVQALGAVIPLFLVTFAAVYLSLSQVSSDHFSEPLNHTGALYFVVTVFSTVGFGDITPESDLARLVVSLQMLLDLVVIGAVVKVLTTAAKTGLAGSSSQASDPAD